MTHHKPLKIPGIKELLLSLLLILALWVAKEFPGIDLTPGTPTEEDDPSGALHVYFTAPQRTENGEGADGLDARLATAIDRAQKSVDVAVFDFDLPRVADALVRADERGVQIRLVTDSDYEEEAGPVQLRDAGIPIVTDERDPFMHNKFVVIDRHETWTGSWNLTHNGTYRNDNNVVVIQSTHIADNYTAEFVEMFERREFGETSPNTVPHPDVTLNGMRVETIFESEGNARERIIALISDAQSSLVFLAFVFTDDDIAQALIARHRAGLDVSGIIEARNADSSGSDFAALKKAGIDIVKDGNPYILHHKVIILDASIVITGSYNFSASAANDNDENILIIHSPEIAAIYLEEFDRVSQQASIAANNN